jgi:hypothetical protein
MLQYHYVFTIAGCHKLRLPRHASATLLTDCWPVQPNKLIAYDLGISVRTRSGFIERE